MSEKVDALFAGEPPPVLRNAQPRLRRIRRALLAALPLTVLGVLCWTGVPGAGIALWAWYQADEEVTHIEDDRYSSEDAAAILLVRRQAGWLLALAVLSLVVQVYLLTTPFYTVLWSMW